MRIGAEMSWVGCHGNMAFFLHILRGGVDNSVYGDGSASTIGVLVALKLVCFKRMRLQPAMGSAMVKKQPGLGCDQ